jgi:hypothetical protein
VIGRCHLCLVLALPSCAADGDGGPTAAGTAGVGATTAADESGASGDPGQSEGPAGESSTGIGDPSAETSASVTDPDSGGSEAGTTSESTGAPPTSGPGVRPGEGGLEAFCRRYVECGGTYYADEQACLDASYGYWGECASRAAALDVFGACMSEIECSDWSPDAYNPASTPCAEQWGDLDASEPC